MAEVYFYTLTNIHPDVFLPAVKMPCTQAKVWNDNHEYLIVTCFSMYDDFEYKSVILTYFFLNILPNQWQHAKHPYFILNFFEPIMLKSFYSAEKYS